MKQIYTFVEAKKNGLIKVGTYLDPTEIFGGDITKRKVVLPSKITGADTQTIYGETLEWVYAVDRRGVGAMRGSCTKKKVVLGGKRGYDNALIALNLVCSLYSNEDKGIESRTIDLYDLFTKKGRVDETSDSLAAIGYYWLGSNYVFAPNYLDHYGVYYVCGGELYVRYLVYSEGHIEWSRNGIRPVVTLPYNVMCDFSQDRDGSTSKRAVRLFFEK